MAITYLRIKRASALRLAQVMLVCASVITRTLIRSNRQNTSITPSSLKACIGSAFIQAQSIFPFRQSEGNAIQGKTTVNGRVQGLFSFGRPTDITFLIVPLFVWKSIYGVLRRGFASKFFQEFLIRFKFELNTITDVSRFISTALSSGVITTVFRRHIIFRAFTVRGCAGNNTFFCPTSTRLSTPTGDARRFNGSCVTAITQTMPHRRCGWSVATVYACKSQYKQAMKSLSRQYTDIRNSFRRFPNGKIVSSHDVFSCLENILVRVVRSYNFFRPAFNIA